jgi:hypothetical protein
MTGLQVYPDRVPRFDIRGFNNPQVSVWLACVKTAEVANWAILASNKISNLPRINVHG